MMQEMAVLVFPQIHARSRIPQSPQAGFYFAPAPPSQLEFWGVFGMDLVARAQATILYTQWWPSGLSSAVCGGS